MTRMTVPAREHVDGCPAEREERYETEKPIYERGGGGVPEQVGTVPMVVVRCIDCGAQLALPKTEEEDDAVDE